MLRVSVRLLGVSPFTLFMMDQKNNPELKGCAISKRGRLLSKMYKELSQNQRQELNRRAARHPTLPKRTREQRAEASRANRRKRKGGFAKFVQENYGQVRELNYRKRFEALSKLYEVMRPIEMEEVAKAVPKLKVSGKLDNAAKSTTARKKIKDTAKIVKTAMEEAVKEAADRDRENVREKVAIKGKKGLKEHEKKAPKEKVTKGRKEKLT
uniref:Putative kinetoplast DNA-associated protein n=1 Tax=Trypanosoma congolense (strain IL3000) TaxID=1068625 RepID=G0UX74_TRYCI|nr:putative kinetoplast DNA-associated protein [Trypanosoma congolense IL3000]